MTEEMNWNLEGSGAELDKVRCLADECWAERQRIKDTEAELERSKKEIAVKEAIIKEALEAAGLTAFAASLCIYEMKEEEGVAGPESDEDWVKFKGWMKEKYPEAYEGFFKMHLGSLKAFVKKEMVIARDKGETDFSIPGIPAPKPFVLLKPKARK